MPERYAGVLLHLTSLPGPFGIGGLGYDAHRFVGFLHEAGQRLWQILPLSPSGAGNSPYAARSTFAGNPLLVAPEYLAEDGLLTESDLHAATFEAAARIAWGPVEAANARLLRTAFARWQDGGGRDGYEQFCADAAGWLDDYALFMALNRAHGDASWLEWPKALRTREAAELAHARRELADELAFEAFVQWQFFRQWGRLRGHANERGIRIIGDVPIFVDHDSADTWANQGIFQLDGEGRPLAVAGVPPDYFSQTGQHWGNPLYRWDVLAADGYRWWVERMRWTLRTVDIVRLDHFRGFAAAWEIPAGKAAAEGAWAEGPGARLFEALAGELGPMPVVAEDLGVITDDVIALRDSLGLPGMKVLQFAFGDEEFASNPYLPHNLDRRAVIYTGTHDNDTTAGWLAAIDGRIRTNLQRYLGLEDPATPDLARLAYESVAEMAVLPMQDVLGLGTESRMNVPGQADGNWGWRFSWEQVQPGCAPSLRELASLSGRLPRH
ncbi:MAG: 4-alpha-glucanotransferase [Gemmataceae bacterium]|nr:4-alpha-glucanotransferase [Gemmataceae bacterium]